MASLQDRLANFGIGAQDWAQFCALEQVRLSQEDMASSLWFKKTANPPYTLFNNAPVRSQEERWNAFYAWHMSQGQPSPAPAPAPPLSDNQEGPQPAPQGDAHRKAQLAGQLWNAFVMRSRRILDEVQLPLFASPRFSFAASKAILSGDSFEEALEGSLWQGMEEEQLTAGNNPKARILALWDARLANAINACKVPAPQGDITQKISLRGKHHMAKRIVRAMLRRAYAFLFGGPGAGKSHLVESFATDMDLEFQCLTLHEDSTKSEFVGNKSLLTGDYFSAKFCELYEGGGVCLADEAGLGTGKVANLLNGAMAQKRLDLPNGLRVKMHENFFLLLADNSNLWGTSSRFPERNDLGGAFRDRLTYIPFSYDNDLQLQIETNIFFSNMMEGGN